jgi:hypothetical protein
MEICLIDTTTDKDEWVEVVVKDYIKWMRENLKLS